MIPFYDEAGHVPADVERALCELRDDLTLVLDDGLAVLGLSDNERIRFMFVRLLVRLHLEAIRANRSAESTGGPGNV